MAEHSKTFEIAIAAIGIVVTGLLGYGQYRLGVNQQNAEQKRAIDNIEVQVMSLVAPHLSNLAKPSSEFLPSQKIVLAASEYLSTQHDRTALAAMSAKISEGNPSVSAEVSVRIQEATLAVPASSSWFTVLATLPPDDEKAAARIANQWLEKAKAKGSDPKIALYKTKISNNYAVVLGGPLPRANAVELAASSRRTGLASDSFAQQDRQWSLVGHAPFKQ